MVILEDILKTLKETIRYIGWVPYVLIVLAFIIVVFAKQIDIKEIQILDVEVSIQGLYAAGLVVFVIGVVIALTNLLAKRFNTPVGKTLSDGFVAGTLAGIIGGGLGFGWKGSYSGDENLFYLVAIVTILSLPTGGVIGFAAAFIRDNGLEWRRHGTTVLFFVALLIVASVFVLANSVPSVQSGAIRIYEIHLIFEVYCLNMIAFYIIEKGWNIRKSASRLVVAVFASA